MDSNVPAIVRREVASLERKIIRVEQRLLEQGTRPFSWQQVPDQEKWQTAWGVWWRTADYRPSGSTLAAGPHNPRSQHRQLISNPFSWALSDREFGVAGRWVGWATCHGRPSAAISAGPC